jgi:hypothetical protein
VDNGAVGLLAGLAQRASGLLPSDNFEYGGDPSLPQSMEQVESVPGFSQIEEFMDLNRRPDANWDPDVLLPPIYCVDTYHELDVLYGNINRRQLT